MYSIKLILENGVEVHIVDIGDDEIRITKKQMKCKCLEKVCIRTEKEKIYIVKKDIKLIGYTKEEDSLPSWTSVVNEGLYQ